MHFTGSVRKPHALGFIIFCAVLIYSSVGLSATLPNGGKISDEISIVGEIDEYTFTAAAGETVYVRAADTETTQFVSSPFSPSITLISPSDTVLRFARGTLVAAIGESLVESGTYRVLIRDDSGGGDETGTYDLYFAKAPGANDDGVLPNGGRKSDQIDLGDIDSYTFTANAGETIYLRAADTETTEFVSSPFSPEITLLSPSGSVLETARGTLVASIGETLIESGTFTVIVQDDSGGLDGVGTYDIYFAKAPGANDDGCIADGQSANGFIDLGDLDSYQFFASAGTFLAITASDLDSSVFTPELILLSETGNVVASSRGTTTAQISRNLTSTGTYTLIVRDDSGGFDAVGNYRLDISGVSVSCPAMECNGLPITVFIGNGDLPTTSNDVILGTSGADNIEARSGNDTICSLGGDDVINGGGGNDWIDGGTGSDDIQGSAGIDTIFGGLGNDVIRGGIDNDDIAGEEGDDTLLGQGGDDDLDGGPGVDDIKGGSGNDTIYTGAGATVGSGVFVSGGGGNDTIHGGADADDLRGTAGVDTINGEGGDDVITGGNGRDTIDGGAGNDIISGQGSRDTIYGGNGADTINGGDENDVVNGGAGADTISGAAGDDILRGDSGNDVIRGGAGDDQLFGGSSGSDVCEGQSGTDTADASCETIIGVP